MQSPKERALFGAWLIFAGVFTTFVHEYTYRRTEQNGDYELGGLVSHAGTDMLITTVAVTVAALVWLAARLR